MNIVFVHNCIYFKSCLSRAIYVEKQNILYCTSQCELCMLTTQFLHTSVFFYVSFYQNVLKPVKLNDLTKNLTIRSWCLIYVNVTTKIKRIYHESSIENVFFSVNPVKFCKMMNLSWFHPVANQIFANEIGRQWHTQPCSIKTNRKTNFWTRSSFKLWTRCTLKGFLSHRFWHALQ